MKLQLIISQIFEFIKLQKDQSNKIKNQNLYQEEENFFDCQSKKPQNLNLIKQNDQFIRITIEMGNSIYEEIQKKYGQDGIDYVAFRYHERKWYRQVIQKIKHIKQKATEQQQQKLDLIIKEKRKLQKDFQYALKNSQIEHPDTIKKAETKSKQKVQDFSGFNTQWNRLDNIYKQVNSKYEAEKTSIEKKIRQDVMRQQNKSELKTIKEFDYRSDKTRRKIETQCIQKHPEKALLAGAEKILENIEWQNYEETFQAILNQTQFLAQAEAGRYKVRNAIVLSNNLICC